MDMPQPETSDTLRESLLCQEKTGGQPSCLSITLIRVRHQCQIIALIHIVNQIIRQNTPASHRFYLILDLA